MMAVTFDGYLVQSLDYRVEKERGRGHFKVHACNFHKYNKMCLLQNNELSLWESKKCNCGKFSHASTTPLFKKFLTPLVMNTYEHAKLTYA